LPILAVIASEWLTVLAYITTSLIKLEYALEHPDYRDTTSGLDFALDRLHPLRRLMPVYRTMLTEILSTVLAPQDQPLNIPKNTENGLSKLRSDFLIILARLDRLETRSSNIISLATALISVEENNSLCPNNSLC